MAILRSLECIFAFVSVGLLFVFVLRKNNISHQELIAETNDDVLRTRNITHTPTLLGKIDSNRKYAVFATTSVGNAESVGFIFLLPLTTLAWKRIGFDSIVLIVGTESVWRSDRLLNVVLNGLRRFDAVVIFLNEMPPVNAVMVSQVKYKPVLPHGAICMLARYTLLPCVCVCVCPSVCFSVCQFLFPVVKIPVVKNWK